MEENRLGTMLWRGKHVVLLAVVAMVAAAIAVTEVSDPAYEATTVLRVHQSTVAENGSDAYNSEQASQTQAATYATLLRSPSFLNRVAPKLQGGFAFSGRDLANRVRAQAIQGTNLVEVSFRATTRNWAVHYTRAVATAAIAEFDRDFTAARARQQQALGARVKAVATQIAKLQSSTDPAVVQQVAALRLASNELTTRYGRMLSESAAGSPVLVVAGPPSAPSSPVSPRPLLNVIAGLLLGLLVGVGLAWLRERVAVTTTPAVRRVAD
jgi:capsular polysaccharide biosynthesis protein